MLTKNLDVSQGLVNGARGVVIGFETEGKGWFLTGTPWMISSWVVMWFGFFLQ